MNLLKANSGKKLVNRELIRLFLPHLSLVLSRSPTPDKPTLLTHILQAAFIGFCHCRSQASTLGVGGRSRKRQNGATVVPNLPKLSMDPMSLPLHPPANPTRISWTPGKACGSHLSPPHLQVTPVSALALTGHACPPPPARPLIPSNMLDPPTPY